MYIIFVFRSMSNNPQHITGPCGPATTTINALKEAISRTSGSPSWVTTQVL